MSILIKGISSLKEGLYQVQDGKIHAYKGNGGKVQEFDLVEVPTPHGRLIDGDVFIREINERIDAAIKWGTNAIADRENEIRLRAEQAVATFCEASLTAKKMPTIIEAEEGEEK